MEENTKQNEYKNRHEIGSHKKRMLRKIGRHIIHPNLLSLIVVAIIVGGVCFYFGTISEPEEEHEETVTQLSLKDIGTLATQEAYVTVVESMDENRNFFSTGINVPLTNSVCIFSHDFQITAGYDFEKIVPIVEAKTEDKKGKITIPLPDAKILTSGMLSDKEQVYYEKESIFNNLSEEKKSELRKKMGEEAKKIALENGLLKKAKSNAKKVLKNFVYNMYNSQDYEVVFEDVKE